MCVYVVAAAGLRRGSTERSRWETERIESARETPSHADDDPFRPDIAYQLSTLFFLPDREKTAMFPKEYDA